MDLADKLARNKRKARNEARLLSLGQLVIHWLIAVNMVIRIVAETGVVLKMPLESGPMAMAILQSTWMWIFVLIASGYSIRHHTLKIDRLNKDQETTKDK